MTTGSDMNTIRMQKILVSVSVMLFIVKIIAWILTASVAILTDALESTVNVIAGFIGLYSIIIAAKPKDREHPYGHGKAEFLSAAIEGILITVAGLIIVYEAINNLVHPHDIRKLDFGLVLIAITAVVNYITGHYCVKKGKKENSPILIASGSHLKSDTYSTLGLMTGLALILITGYLWIDSIAALLFAFIIIFTGYKIIRKSVSGIMDESDSEIIAEIANVLNNNRKPDWIDVHNIRVINYAGFYHIDCHLTVPFYINVNQAHTVHDSFTSLLKVHFRNRVEFFVHVDGCLPYQCSLCAVENCTERKANFVRQIIWTEENLLSNNKHVLNDETK